MGDDNKKVPVQPETPKEPAAPAKAPSKSTDVSLPAEPPAADEAVPAGYTKTHDGSYVKQLGANTYDIILPGGNSPMRVITDDTGKPISFGPPGLEDTDGGVALQGDADSLDTGESAPAAMPGPAPKKSALDIAAERILDSKLEPAPAKKPDPGSAALDIAAEDILDTELKAPTAAPPAADQIRAALRNEPPLPEPHPPGRVLDDEPDLDPSYLIVNEDPPVPEHAQPQVQVPAAVSAPLPTEPQHLNVELESYYKLRDPFVRPAKIEFSDVTSVEAMEPEPNLNLEVATPYNPKADPFAHKKVELSDVTSVEPIEGDLDTKAAFEKGYQLKDPFEPKKVELSDVTSKEALDGDPETKRMYEEGIARDGVFATPFTNKVVDPLSDVTSKEALDGDPATRQMYEDVSQQPDPFNPKFVDLSPPIPQGSGPYNPDAYVLFDEDGNEVEGLLPGVPVGPKVSEAIKTPYEYNPASLDYKPPTLAETFAVQGPVPLQPEGTAVELSAPSPNAPPGENVDEPYDPNLINIDFSILAPLRRKHSGLPYRPDPMETLLRDEQVFRFQIYEKEAPVNCVVAQANPTEFTDGVDIDWNRFTAAGSSFAHMHFHSTKNYVVELELYWRVTNPDELVQSREVRQMLNSWCFPLRFGGLSQGPPRLIAIWPHAFNIECYLVGLKMKNLRFSPRGHSTRWVAEIKLEQCRDAWIAGNDLRSLSPSQDVDIVQGE